MFAPPDEETDWVVVHRLTNENLRASAASPAERHEAALVLLRRRWSVNQVALRLWMSHSVVTRLAADLAA
jgi:hypothetical protein